MTLVQMILKAKTDWEAMTGQVARRVYVSPLAQVRVIQELGVAAFLPGKEITPLFVPKFFGRTEDPDLEWFWDTNIGNGIQFKFRREVDP